MQAPAAVQTSLLAIGLVFSVLAALCAYVISYHEYRQRMLRLDQNPARMAMGTAAATFVVFAVGSAILAMTL